VISLKIPGRDNRIDACRTYSIKMSKACAAGAVERQARRAHFEGVLAFGLARDCYSLEFLGYSC
jgi:hypothetical protein